MVFYRINSIISVITITFMEKIINILRQKGYNSRFIKKDTLLFSEGEECKNVGIVEKGKIKIASYTAEGNEVIYNLISPNEMFGANLIFSSDKAYRGDVIAEEDSEIYLLTKNQLTELIQTDKEFLEIFLNKQSNFAKSLNFKIKLLTFNNAEKRFLYYLEMNNNKIQIKNISSLAKELNLTREALSRTIHKLENKKIISFNGAKIIKL